MIIEAVSLASKLHELNGNKIIKTKDKYPVLKTRKKTPESWWNSLKWSEKVDVGVVALHYHKMTASYLWRCKDETMFNDCTKSQQKIIKFVFAKRNDNWYMFDIMGVLGL